MKKCIVTVCNVHIYSCLCKQMYKSYVILCLEYYSVFQTSNEFIEKYNDALVKTKYNISTVYQLAFDTIWTLAKVLNYTEEMRLQNDTSDSVLEKCSHLNMSGELVPLNNFTYSNAFMGCVMKENYHKVNFTGVSVGSKCNVSTTRPLETESKQKSNFGQSTHAL